MAIGRLFRATTGIGCFTGLKIARAALVLICWMGAGPLHAQAESPASPATFINPVDGAVLDPGQSVRWTAQPGALAYYLYVGTAPGLKDLINSRETQATEWSGRSLPVGRTLYARIHTKYASGWVNSSITFSVRPVAVFTNPATDGATIEPIFRFEWTAIEDAAAYFLYAGSAPGLKDYVNSNEIHTNHFSVAGLPAGKTIYLRLHTLQDGVWRSVDLTANVSPVATFIDPTNNDQNVDPRGALRWRAVENAQAYYLYVGTARGRKDLVDSRETQATSWPSTFIPAGETVYARLHTKFGGVWRFVDIAFRLSPQAVFIEPSADGGAVDPRAPLIWTDVPSAEAYFLYVGTTAGARDLINSGETKALSRDISALPRGQLLYATLYTKSGGAWRSVQRSFSVLPVATLLNRSDAPSQLDTRTPLKWIAVDGAQAYYLYVGSIPGAKDLINSREIQATQFSIQSLPAGQVIYVRLFTKHGGVWRYVDSTLKTKSVAYLSGTAPTSGAWASGTSLTWTPFAGATKYYLYVGSAPGRKDIWSSGETTTTEFRLPLHMSAWLSSDQPVSVRLYSFVDGQWLYVDYLLQYRAAAVLSFPVNDAVNADVTALPLEWTEVDDAEGYRVEVGTSIGAGDVLDTGEIRENSVRSGAIPGGATLFARTWTKVAGDWRFTDSRFTTRPAAAFMHPRHGELNVNVAQPIEWLAIPGADKYRVELGSAPGTHDLLDTGELSSTTISASSALSSAPAVIYGRIWTRYGGTWRFSDSIFSTVSQPNVAEMIWPAGNDTVTASEGFRWTASPLAASYRLRLGTVPGGSDLHDSGPIRTVRRMVENLPVGVQLHGSLDTEYIDGTMASEQFDFTVVDAAIDFDQYWTQAMWATAEVRSMATPKNVPLPNTLLLDEARWQLRDSAYCTAYAAALMDLLEASNIKVEARILNVCLNSNRYDCHTLVEVLEPDTNRWLILDPTFGLVAKRVSDGKWATAIDISLATQSQDFAAIEYVPLTPGGFTYAHGYYLDYPLLFTQVLAPGNAQFMTSMPSTLQYYDMMETDTISGQGIYALVCADGSDEARIRVTGTGLETDADGVAVVSCSSASDGLSHIFSATSVSPADGTSPYEIVVPKRFVFL
jgi:hypothetical protein